MCGCVLCLDIVSVLERNKRAYCEVGEERELRGAAPNRETTRIEDPETIAKRSIRLLEEWRNVQSARSESPPKPRERWLPPAQGWTKVNVDGAMAKDLNKGGGGVVVRDHGSRFLAGASRFSPPCLIPRMPRCGLARLPSS